MSAGDRIRKATSGSAAEQRPAFRKPSGRASYPRRVTLDLDDDRYAWMRRYAYDSRSTIAELLRAAIDELRDDEKLADRVFERAAPPPPS